MSLPAPTDFRVLGVRLDPLSEGELVQRLERHLLAGRGLLTITTVNAECVALARDRKSVV